MRKIIDNYILPIFILAFCIVIVKFSAVVSYASTVNDGDYRYGGYWDQTSGLISNNAVYSMSQWESILSGLSVGNRPSHSAGTSVSSGVGFFTVNQERRAYDYFDFSCGAPIESVTGFSLVSYNTQYYMVKFSGIPAVSGALSHTYYLSDVLGRYILVSKSSVPSHKITPITGTGYYWIDTTYLGTLDRHYVDADTFSRIKLACSAAYRSNAIAIVQEGFQLDGTPSYVLKYLKNGEWVGVVCDEWGPVYCTTINGVGFHGDDGAGDSGNGAFFDDTEVINAINSVYRAISSVDDTLSYISTYTSRLNNNFVNFANELLTSLHMQSNDISNIYSVLLAMYQSFYDRFSDLDLTYYNDSEITIYNGENVDWSESDCGAIDIEANDIGTLELSGFPNVDGYRVSHSIGGDIVVERNDGTYFPNEWGLSGGTVTMPTIESAYSSITVTAPVGTTITVAGNTHTFDDDAPYVVNVEFGTYTVSGSYVDNGTTLTADQEVVVDGYNDYAVEFTATPGGFTAYFRSVSYASFLHFYIHDHVPSSRYDTSGRVECSFDRGTTYDLPLGSFLSWTRVASGFSYSFYVNDIEYSQAEYSSYYTGAYYIVTSDCYFDINYNTKTDKFTFRVYTTESGSGVGSIDATCAVTVNPPTYTPVTISRLVRPSGSSVWLAYDTEGNVHEFTPASNLALNRSFVTHTYTAAEIADLDNFPTGYWQVTWTGESHYITVKFEEYSKFFLWLNRFLINFRDTLFMKMQDISVNAEGDLIMAGSAYDDTVLIAKLTDIENALSNIGETVNYDTDIDIPIDNDIYNVFYVDDGDDDKSIVDLSKDSVKVFGKLLNFLYKVMIKDALSDGGGVGALSDFYLDNDEEVIDLWAS